LNCIAGLNCCGPVEPGFCWPGNGFIRDWERKMGIFYIIFLIFEKKKKKSMSLGFYKVNLNV
jgi:hypothetical protein